MRALIERPLGPGSVPLKGMKAVLGNLKLFFMRQQSIL